MTQIRRTSRKPNLSTETKFRFRNKHFFSFVNAQGPLIHQGTSDSIHSFIQTKTMTQDGGNKNGGHDVEASREYRPFEDVDTKVPRVMSFEQEGGNGMN